jgi:hypothetical protein
MDRVNFPQRGRPAFGRAPPWFDFSFISQLNAKSKKTKEKSNSTA